MLHELNLAAFTLSFEFRPNEMILDFELGAINALKYEFPQSGLIGCFFFILDNFVIFETLVLKQITLKMKKLK